MSSCHLGPKLPWTFISEKQNLLCDMRAITSETEHGAYLAQFFLAFWSAASIFPLISWSSYCNGYQVKLCGSGRCLLPPLATDPKIYSISTACSDSAKISATQHTGDTAAKKDMQTLTVNHRRKLSTLTLVLRRGCYSYIVDECARSPPIERANDQTLTLSESLRST